jgi:hypothetical protein
VDLDFEVLGGFQVLVVSEEGTLCINGIRSGARGVPRM